MNQISYFHKKQAHKQQQQLFIVDEFSWKISIQIFIFIHISLLLLFAERSEWIYDEE